MREWQKTRKAGIMLLQSKRKLSFKASEQSVGFFGQKNTANKSLRHWQKDKSGKRLA
jgi:hypothetical protein